MREGGTNRQTDRIGTPSSNLGRRYYGKRVHDSVGIFLSDLGDKERAHSTSGSTAQGVRQLESLKAVARLGFLADDVEDRVDELGALRVMTLGPVVAGARLAEHEIVWSEDLAERPGPDRVHRTRLQVHQTRARNVFPA